MVSGGDGMKKSKYMTKKTKSGNDSVTKKPKNGKKQKVKRGISRSKSPKNEERRKSDDLSEHSQSQRELLMVTPERDVDCGCMIKPEKMDRTCITMWSEPTVCCIKPIEQTVSTQTQSFEPKCKNVCLQITRKERKTDVEPENQAKLCIERVSNERDYYREEFQRLLTFFQKLSQPSDDDNNELLCALCQKKQQTINYLVKENEVLAKERLCLMTRLEDGAIQFEIDSPIAKCSKPSCKRIERERDLLKLDIDRLEQETDCLRVKIKAINESKTRDYAKFNEQILEYENSINKLEGERRELMKNQGIRRVTINSLEEKLDMYSNLLRVAQEEVHRLKTQYCQLKKLHSQCDKALLDTQAQLEQAEAELKQKPTSCIKNKRVSRNVQISLPKCECTDEATNPRSSTSFSLEDIQKKLQILDQDKDSLVCETETPLVCCKKC